MLYVDQLFIYPVKSMQGISLQHSLALANGLEFDRYFMITKPDGSFITAREYPQLLKLSVKKRQNGISIMLKNEQKIDVKFSDFSLGLEPTEVWGTQFSAQIASINVNRFLSEFLQQDVQLRWVGKQFSRHLKRYPDNPLGFADAYPFLLINKASFDYVQQQCSESLNIKQFRGNIIIDGALPFAEDGWKTIKIGEVIFDIVKPCSRCVMTTVKLDNYQYFANNEPLKTLSYFRQDQNGEIDFGMNMIARNNGKINLNDPIEILTRQPAKQYIKVESSKDLLPAQDCIISIENMTIKGNNQKPIIEQLEENGVLVPYSCRAGVCGRCKITLLDGEVEPIVRSAIRRNNQILACSCIPKTNIKLKL